jgi:galactose oxidase
MRRLLPWILDLLRRLLALLGLGTAAVGTEPPPEPADAGRWDPVFPLPNVAIHASLLPDGRVLFWGRRDDPGGSLDEHACTPHVWDPATGTTVATPQPMRADGTTVNLFCSGHAFLPDGRLLVAGGHRFDADGIDQACTYDHATNTWTPTPHLNAGRWYPTAAALADGRVLVVSGSAAVGATIVIDAIPEIGDGTGWAPTVDFVGLPLYPRLHVAPDGRVFMAGSNAMTYLLDTAGAGTWTQLGPRINGDRQYAPSVQYAPGKVLYAGGGNDAGTDLPTAATEVIDLDDAAPAWRPAAPMAFRRRQHNATLLPDGTVLVTGGTAGPGFNDVSPGKPVHAAELWNPATGTWTSLAAEGADRCYHSTVLLLPDGTVLSAGGGEYKDGPNPNAPADTHRDAQVFRPPYLFRGPRPEITSAPAEIAAGATFTIEAGGPAATRVTLVRLGSVTHTVNAGQCFVPVPFVTRGAALEATLPARPGDCLPGHYLLFVLSAAGVPSVGRIVRVTTAAQVHPPVHALAAHLAAAPATWAEGTRVTVGLTAQCPYGLAACWGGAYEALGGLAGVVAVAPHANAADSTAEVYLHGDDLPDLDAWPAELAHSANGSYAFRGIELTLHGTVEHRDGHLVLTGGPVDVLLRPLEPGDELAWDLETAALRPASPEERDAYRRVEAGAAVRVTGPATHTDSGWSLAVRTVAPTG